MRIVEPRELTSVTGGNTCWACLYYTAAELARRGREWLRNQFNFPWH